MKFASQFDLLGLLHCQQYQVMLNNSMAKKNPFLFPVRQKVSFNNIIHSALHLSVKHLNRMLELLTRKP
jgi:hypothetical protein